MFMQLLNIFHCAHLLRLIVNIIDEITTVRKTDQRTEALVVTHHPGSTEECSYSTSPPLVHRLRKSIIIITTKLTNMLTNILN